MAFSDALLKLAGYGYTLLAAWKIARGEGNKQIQVTGVIGALLSLFHGFAFWPLPGFSSSLGTESYSCLVVWVALGIIFYFTSARKIEEEQALTA